MEQRLNSNPHEHPAEREPAKLVDLLAPDEGADIEFEPERIGLTTRTPDL